MPLVRVSLRQGKSDDYKEAIGDGVYQALRETFNVPEEDRFVVVSEHSESELQFSKTYMDIARSDDLVILQITVSNTRTVEQKKALFARIVGSAGAGSRPAQGRRVHQPCRSRKRKLVVRQRHRPICLSARSTHG